MITTLPFSPVPLIFHLEKISASLNAFLVDWLFKSQHDTVKEGIDCEE